MNKIEIYYFSGTGNSLYVAKELQKRIPESNLIPVVSLLDKDVIETNGETVGFVFPVYLMTVPVAIRDFVKKLNLKSTQYIFAIATRGGTEHRAFICIDKMLKKSGEALDSYFTLNMADNNPRFKVYNVPTNEEIAKMESEVQDRLDLIQKTIINKEKNCEKDTHITAPIPFIMTLLSPLFTAIAEHSYPDDDFYSDSKCSGCGICEKVCLSKKIKMINNKPVWQENAKCFSCRACLNYCPVQSVQIKTKPYMKSYTDKNGRYPHPFATVSDIAGQK